MLRLGLILSLVTVNLFGQKAPPGTVVDGDLGQRLEAAMATRPQFWGAVLAATDGQVAFAKGFGAADFQKLPIGPHSVFDLGNTTHHLTTLLVLRLAQDHRLNLDAPIGKLWKDWPADKAAITWAQLIAMKSGLPPDATWGGGAAGASRTAVQAIGRAPLANPPGDKVVYSTLNGILMALGTEEVAGGRFEKLLAERVLKPAGMADAGFMDGRFDDKVVTWRRTSASEPGTPATALELNWAHRGGRGVLGSVLDVHELLRRLCDGKLLGEEQRARLWQPTGTTDAYSVDRRTVGDREFVRVRGNTGGYRARWCVEPSHRTWLVVLTGPDGDLEALEGDLLQILLTPPKATAEPTASIAAPAPPANDPATLAAASWRGVDRARYEGVFELPLNGGQLVVRRDGDGLVLAGSGLQSSARLANGLWPDPAEAALRHALDRGLSIAERLVADDGTVDRDGFASLAAGAAARTFVREWLAANGPLAATEFLGTLRTPAPSRSWLRLRGRTESLEMILTWADANHVASWVAATGPQPFAVPLAFVRADCGMAQSLAGTPLLVTIEGTAPNRTLVFEDASLDRDGLVECREVGPR